jgi:RNase adapter protein RapZ
LRDFVLITGFSGAGKSQAMACFEDAGYFCVDNLPPEMIVQLADLLEHDGSQVQRAAVACDVRGGEFFEGLIAVLDELESRQVPHRLLFLAASEDVLVNRYKETRRRHPLGEQLEPGGGSRGGTIVRAIDVEKRLLQPLRDRADVSIDTSDFSAARLRKVVADKMLPRGTVGKLAVTFVTYGFKHGPPRDADLLFDVRFLPNPHYENELRPLTGFDARIVDYVARDGRLQEFYDRVVPLLEYLLPNYVTEGKSHLLVAVGCTGGRHRSVAIVEELGRRFSSDPRLQVEVQHRDVDRAPARR